MKRHNNSSAFVTYTIIALLSAAISFVTMIILTRTASEAFFGKINKFIMASNVVMSFICLGLDSAYIRFYYEPPKGSNSKQLAWKCMIPACAVLVVVSFIIVSLRNNSFLSLLIGGKGIFFSMAFVITIFSLLINRFMTIYFRMSSSILCFSVVSIMYVLLTKTIFVPIYCIDAKFENDIIVPSLLLAVFMLFFFLFNKKNMVARPQSTASNYKPVYRYAFLSSPVIVILYLNSYLPQVVISKNMGDDILGIYSAALLFCLAIQVLSTGFTTFWSPYMFKNYKTETTTIKQIHDLVLFGSILAMSLILLFNDFLYLFIGEAFRKSQNILGMLLVYPIVVVITETTAYGIDIKKKNEISLFIYMISTALNAVLCVALISKYGLAGVAFASMVSATIQMGLMTYFGQKYYPSINQIGRTLFHMFVLILSAILFYFLYDNRIIFIIAQTAMLIACLVYDKKVILWSSRFLRPKRDERNN